jgi:hypothetical protein
VSAPAASPPALAPPRPGSRFLRPAYVAGLLATDVLATAVAFVAAYTWLVRTSERAAATLPPLVAYARPLAVLLLVLVLTFALSRLYIPRRDTSYLDSLAAIAQAVTIANVVALAAAAFGTRAVDVPTFVLVWTWVGSIMLIWLGRMALHAVLAILRRRGWDEARVVIVGAGDAGRLLQAKVRAAPELGYRVVGFLDAPPSLAAEAPTRDSVQPPASAPGSRATPALAGLAPTRGRVAAAFPAASSGATNSDAGSRRIHHGAR